MKKALLSTFAILLFITSYAQKTGQRVILPGAVKDSVMYVNNYPGQVYDSTTFPSLYVTTSSTGYYGFNTGMNSDNIVGYAESYDPSIGLDSAWKIIGVYSIWTGTYSSTTTKFVNVEAWSTDTTNIESYGGSDSIRGLPGKSIAQTGPIKITNLGIGSGLHSKYSDQPMAIFFTKPAKITQPFFVGYEGPYTSNALTSFYTWGANGGDTIAIRSTTQGAQVGQTNYYYTKGHGTTTYKMYHSRNAEEKPLSSGGGWGDLTNNATSTTRVNLAIVPIFTPYSTLSVNSITNRNLTFYSNYPNPAVNSTTIKYALANTSDVAILVMDMTGRTLKTINQPSQTQGEHTYTLNTTDLAAGDYIYTVKTGEGAAMAGKMTIVR